LGAFRKSWEKRVETGPQMANWGCLFLNLIVADERLLGQNKL